MRERRVGGLVLLVFARGVVAGVVFPSCIAAIAGAAFADVDYFT